MVSLSCSILGICQAFATDHHVVCTRALRSSTAEHLSNTQNSQGSGPKKQIKFSLKYAIFFFISRIDNFLNGSEVVFPARLL